MCFLMLLFHKNFLMHGPFQNLFHSLVTTAIPEISSLLPPSLVNEHNCIGGGGGISHIYWLRLSEPCNSLKI